MDDSPLRKVSEGFLGNLFLSAVIVILGAVALKIIERLVKRMVLRLEKAGSEKEKLSPRLATIQGIIMDVSKVSVWSVGFIMILSAWGFNIAPIITGAGILGLAIGFGTQTLVKDVVTGFFILIENQFNQGDKVEIAGSKGMIKEVNLRTIVVKTDDGAIHIIPNSSITKVIRFSDK